MLIYLPPVDLVIELHEVILEISGGRPGVLNAHVIDAAIHRPKTYLAYHPDCDLHVICAVLMDSIARNHAFVEGNKRTGLMTAILTYELNGIKIDKAADESAEYEDLVVWVVTQKPDIEELATRLRSLSKKYQVKGVSKYISNLRKSIKPYESE